MIVPTCRKCRKQHYNVKTCEQALADEKKWVFPIHIDERTSVEVIGPGLVREKRTEDED